MRKLLLALALAAATPLCASAMTTTAIPADGSWNSFYFGDVGSTLLDDFAFNSPNEQAFSFTLTRDGVLRVTDAGLPGDQFQIVLNGSPLGNTSSVAAGSADQGVDFAGAYVNPLFSHGEWSLHAGSYTVRGVVLASPDGAGIGALAVAVPEPTSLALLLGGLALLARRRA